MTDDSLHKVVIRQETPNDSEEIRALLAEAFPSDTEAHLVDALRCAGNLSIEPVAELTGRIIGMVAFPPVKVKGENEAIGLGLAPVAVAPE